MSEERLTRMEDKLDKALASRAKHDAKVSVEIAKLKTNQKFHYFGLALILSFTWDLIRKKLGL